jgi:Ni/Fe-hydrogenase subunit HybB-like protein
MSAHALAPADAVSPFQAEGETFASIGRAAADIPLREGWGTWWLAMAAALALTGVLAISLLFLFWDGTAIWGNNIPVTWALDIVSYDWWIGIACGGLLVSGASLLMNLEWRGALNRIGETIALIAAAAAAIYPIIHLGRPWFFYWNLPYPNSFALWPQFRSPLFWDAIDIVSFLGVAVGTWFVGLLPDLATLRDRAWARAGAEGRGLLRAQLYGIAALGWRGSSVHWYRWIQAYRNLALLGVVTVVSLQTGAAVMFAGSLEPGWHDTLLPVNYLAGAVFAGVGTLSVLTVILRSAFQLQGLITGRHLQVLSRLLLGLCLLNIYCLAASSFTTRLGGDSFELAALARRAGGPVAWSFWMLVTAALLPPLLFLVPRLRRSPRVLAWVGGAVAAGIWGDHYTLIVATLQHDFLPSSAHATHIAAFGWSTFAGSAGLFLLLLLLFLRLLPVVSVQASRALTSRTGGDAGAAGPGKPHDAPIWGVAGEFATEADMVQALRALQALPGVRIDGYSPVPSVGAGQALGLRSHVLLALAWGGGLVGAALMFGMCSYATVYDYVFDIGGRPRFSWPAFIVPSVSFGCLCAGLATVGGLLVLNRMPRLNHPAFNIPGIGRGSWDRFFAVAHGRHGSAFDPRKTEQAFRDLAAAPLSVAEVPR